jgi:cyclopropane fatty-acyl-phospholipid synthase-like methyltransferase
MTAAPIDNSAEYQRWNKRYSAPEYIFGEGPNYFLASCQDLLPKSGRALAIADGEGRNGVWLAEQGLDVVSLDFAPEGQAKARKLADKRGVKIEIVEANVHTWDYPENAFDVVVEIFTQFSTPSERAIKWAGMRKALKPGGLMIIQGYTPKHLEYNTGGPGKLEQLYTRQMLEEAFAGMKDIKIVEEELEMHEGSSHGGMSAVVNFTAKK